MENEKYGIELEAKTNAFIKGIKEASKYVKAFSEGVKESFNEQVNKSFNDFKDIKDKMFGKNQKIETPEIKGGYEKQIEYVKNQLKDIEEQKKNAFKLVPISNTEQNMTKLNDYKKTLEDLDSVIKEQQEINAKMGIPDSKSKIIESLMNDKAKYEKAINEMVKVEPDTEKINELEIQYEALENKLLRLENKQEEYNDSLEDMGNDGKKSTSILGNLFDNSIGKIKRFTYYLLGARSIFSMFMKYQGIYYQYNEQMQYQTELSQNAIALSLAPAFEFLGNVVAYASIAFAKFIELLTGVNVLSKVSTKGIRDYNKSLKETQTLLSGVDEITNLTLPSGTGLASQYQALDDFKKKIAEVEKWFNENPWIKTITDGISGIFNFITEHWDIFKYVFGAVGIGALAFKMTVSLGGIASAIGTLGGIGKLGSVGTGLAGLAGLLSYLSTISMIYMTIKIASAFADQKTKELLELIAGKTKENKDSPVNQEVKKLLDEVEEAIKKLSTLSSDSDEYKNLAEQIRLKWDKIKEKMGDNIYVLNDNIDKAKEVKTEFDKVFDGTYTTKIELDLPKKEMSTWDKFRKGFYNSVADLTGFLPSVSKYFRLKAFTTSQGYANGLDYVPYDEYPAILHKGEAVVPAKYNPTIHSQGNEYTNSLLETVVLKLDDLSKRPNEFIIDGQKFAETTYPLYENARSRNNYIEGVVR